MSEKDVLLQAMMDSEGLPECSAEEYAERVLEQLRKRGYVLVEYPEPDAVVRDARGRTLYGIRPHLPRTPEEDALERRVAEDMLRTPPVIPPELLP